MANVSVSVSEKVYTCFRCKKTISRIVESCKLCLKDFHPKCADSNCHKIYNSKNQLVRCTGPYESLELQSSATKNSVNSNINIVDDDNALDSRVNYLESSTTNNDKNINNTVTSNDDTHMQRILNKIDEIAITNINTLKESL